MKPFLKVTLAIVLAFGTYLPMASPYVIPASLGVGVTVLTVSQVACGPDTLEKLNTTLNQTAHALETAIDTNGKFYAAGTYGLVGSPGAIEMRQRVAKVIHDSNEYLIQALDITKTLTKQTFEGKKIEVLEKLSFAARGLKVGHLTIDLVLQTVATFINQAVSLVQLFNASDTGHMDRLVPKINDHLKVFGHIREVAV